MNRKNLLCAAALLCVSFAATAIDGGTYSAYTPYSVYGIGDLFNPGTAYNWTMGGVGVASRNTRYLNITNPAAVTARDSLAFMSDFSLCQSNRLYRQGALRSANNGFNMLDFAISFPITHHTAMALGIKPFSAIGYGYSDYSADAAVLSRIGTVADSYYGQGSIYEAFASFGATFFRRLSLGAEAMFYFGDITKNHSRVYSESAALSYSQNSELQLNAGAFKFGLQYVQPIGKRITVGLGATYRTSAGIGGYLYNSSLSGNASLQSDTVAFAKGGPFIAGEKAVGLSIKYMEKLRVEVDWAVSDWTDCGFNSYEGLSANPAVFSACRAGSLRVGAEYIPNINDIRYYWNKVAYRAGFYHKTEGYTVNGSPVATNALTAGVTLPVFRWSNGLTLGVEVGRRGASEGNLVRETFINFSLGVNLFDIWFQQHRYE